MRDRQDEPDSRIRVRSDGASPPASLSSATGLGAAVVRLGRRQREGQRHRPRRRAGSMPTQSRARSSSASPTAGSILITAPGQAAQLSRRHPARAGPLGRQDDRDAEAREPVVDADADDDQGEPEAAALGARRPSDEPARQARALSRLELLPHPRHGCALDDRHGRLEGLHPHVQQGCAGRLRPVQGRRQGAGHLEELPVHAERRVSRSFPSRRMQPATAQAPAPSSTAPQASVAAAPSAAAEAVAEPPAKRTVGAVREPASSPTSPISCRAARVRSAPSLPSNPSVRRLASRKGQATREAAPAQAPSCRAGPRPPQSKAGTEKAQRRVPGRDQLDRRAAPAGPGQDARQDRDAARRGCRHPGSGASSSSRGPWPPPSLRRSLHRCSRRRPLAATEERRRQGSCRSRRAGSACRDGTRCSGCGPSAGWRIASRRVRLCGSDPLSGLRPRALAASREPPQPADSHQTETFRPVRSDAARLLTVDGRPLRARQQRANPNNQARTKREHAP